MGLNTVVPRASAPDYVDAQINFLPPGPAWPRFGASVTRRIFSVFAHELSRVHNRALDLIEEVDPRTATDTLSQWERVLGLPDCTNAYPTDAAGRRLAIASKLAAAVSSEDESGNGFLKRIALARGETIEITEPQPFRCGTSKAGTPIYGDHWRFAFVVTGLPCEVSSTFKAGRDTAGERLRTFADITVECLLHKATPSHLTMVIYYTDPTEV